MIYCEMCTATATSFKAYVWHLNSFGVFGSRHHPSGALARAVEPSLLGESFIDEAPPKHPRVWDRWDRGGKSGPVIRLTRDHPRWDHECPLTICPGP